MVGNSDFQTSRETQSSFAALIKEMTSSLLDSPLLVAPVTSFTIETAMPTGLSAHSDALMNFTFMYELDIE